MLLEVFDDTDIVVVVVVVVVDVSVTVVVPADVFVHRTSLERQSSTHFWKCSTNAMG